MNRYRALVARLLELGVLDDGSKPSAPMAAVGYTAPTTVTPVWRDKATPAQRNAFASLLAGWDWTEQPEDRLSKLDVPTQLIAALTLLASAEWATMSAAERNRVQAIINGAAAKARALWTG